MQDLPSEYPPSKRELVMLAGRAAYETAARRAENADRLYQELVSRYPDEATVHYAYGAFLMGSKPDLAVRQFQRELKKNPDHVPSLLQIAMEYLRQGKSQEALPLAERAQRLMPTKDYHMVGWAPRYLVADLVEAMAESPQYSAHVVRVNLQPVPSKQRVLIQMRGSWDQHEPMSGPEFQPLVS